MKTTIKTGLAAILLLAISCTKESIHNSSAISNQSLDQAVTFTIGQHYGGGIIFYIDSTGQHGLIADTVDFPLSTWWNGTIIATGATGTAVGTGKANTHKIILSQSKPGKYAARRCWNYKGGGYNDWFLPSKDELNLLYLQKNVVGGFGKKNHYWSSSESHRYSQTAWSQYFYSGNQAPAWRVNAYYVRAIRTF